MAAFSMSAARLLADAAFYALKKVPDPESTGWSVLQNLQADLSQSTFPQPAAQGFYATKMDTQSRTLYQVLAIGVSWGRMMSGYDPVAPGNAQRPATAFGLNVPPFINAAPSEIPTQLALSGGGKFSSLYIAIYAQIRASIWKQLATTNSSLPLFITGAGLGAPLAQLAALDLRAGQKGPNGESPPTLASTCYAFSAPPVADAAFSSFFNANVTGYSVNLASPLITTDFYPASISGLTIPGTSQNVPAPVPAIDDAWFERSVLSYLPALGGTAPVATSSPASIPNPPAGFDVTEAYSLARLCEIAGRQAQHPMLIDPNPITPFEYMGNVSVQNVPYGSLFTSPTAVVAAFRDTVTWNEFVTMAMDTTTAVTDNGYVQTSLNTLVTSLLAGGSFAQTLISLAGTTRSVYLTGFGFGGAVATMLAFQLPNTVTLKKLYTFGATAPGVYQLAVSINQALGNRSFQVVRPADFLPSGLPSSTFQSVGQRITLNGTTSHDDPATGHTLASYMDLLNPGT